MKTDDVGRFRAAYWQALRELDSVRLRQWEQSRVTLPQLRVLYQVRRTPGITTGELSRLLGITVSTTSGLVIKLADRSLIERSSNLEDRRHVPLRLTDEGQELVGDLSGPGRSYLNRVGAGLGTDLEAVDFAPRDLLMSRLEV